MCSSKQGPFEKWTRTESPDMVILTALVEKEPGDKTSGRKVARRRNTPRLWKCIREKGQHSGEYRRGNEDWVLKLYSHIDGIDENVSGEAEMIGLLEKVQKQNSLALERWPGHSESPPRPSLQI